MRLAALLGIILGSWAAWEWRLTTTVCATVDIWNAKSVINESSQIQELHIENKNSVALVATESTTKSSQESARSAAKYLLSRRNSAQNLAATCRHERAVIAMWVETDTCTLNYTTIPMLPRDEVTCWSTEFWLKKLSVDRYAQTKKFTTKTELKQTTDPKTSLCSHKKSTAIHMVELLVLIQSLRYSKDVFPNTEGRHAHVTAYDSDVECTGKWSKFGLTKSGTKPVSGLTVACSRKMLGKWVSIDGIGIRLCEDTGKLVAGNDIDLYIKTHRIAISWGRQLKTVKTLR